MSEVSRRDLEALVIGSSGHRVLFDLSNDVFEQVALVDFDSATFTARECRYVRDCTPSEIRTLRRALATNALTHRRCKVGNDHLKIAVLS